ncbi:hypothetical protein [Saccharopolyspora oryzae]|uniref:SH3 domain-containing protein n=1 Tax=Saccharopolyspora oryzae TaxID=2997343 RepID=A0ABT4UW72_9PSEU|nr:hypothetical protein [Saccharopolyspora oryzae]MDA3625957.1 hypothetical protein [Saccharopolyspora oryzae]
MRTAIRNALLSAVVAAALPVSGLGGHLGTIAVGIKDALAKTADQSQLRDFREPGVLIRSEPSTAADARGSGGPGDRAAIRGSVPGENVRCADGSNNSEWFEITNRRTSVSGFVSGCYL